MLLDQPILFFREKEGENIGWSRGKRRGEKRM